MHISTASGYAISKQSAERCCVMKHLRLIVLVFIFCSISTMAYTETNNRDHLPGIYYTILDSSTGQILLETGLRVETGDQLITDDNRFYQVSSVVEYTAYADYLYSETYSMTCEEFSIPTANGNSPGKLIGIYHSHTDEAYIPTDGKSSIRGNGSIMKVGEVFAEQLTALGYTVNHDLSLHDPHDANAYIRSRRTATKLLSEQPAALFDIHRNSAPVNQYRLTVNNDQIARIVIVVGRANPYMPTTLGYAKQLKAASDARIPKMIRGIFFARGHYNQDIHPRNILLEIGTEGSTLEEAQKSAVLFAEVIPSVLGGPQDPMPGIGSTTEAAPPGGKSITTGPNIGNIAWGNLLGLIGITSAISIAYLYISTGSWHGVRQKLSQFRNLEFANLFGLRLLRKKKKQKNSDEE